MRTLRAEVTLLTVQIRSLSVAGLSPTILLTELRMRTLSPGLKFLALCTGRKSSSSCSSLTSVAVTVGTVAMGTLDSSVVGFPMMSKVDSS